MTLLALLVLGAACANLATLFAARAADRSRELALRVALGSSRGRLVRQLLTEAVTVSLLGGAAGLVSAYLLLGVLNRSQPFVGELTVSVDARVYLAGLVFTLGSALLFGMAPAWHCLLYTSSITTATSFSRNTRNARRSSPSIASTPAIPISARRPRCV